MPFKVLQQKITDSSAAAALDVRAVLLERSCFMINIISSPGAGKTLFLEKTIPMLIKEGLLCAVITGDCFTSKDAERLDRAGIPAAQITTAGACHLNAQIIKDVLSTQPDRYDLIVVENVGNLICPADFDLGEDMKAAFLSAAEGHDKPAKYPLLFKASGLCVITKTDLLPHVDFDINACKNDIRAINPAITILEVSSTSGAGISEAARWLKKLVKAKKEARV